MSSSPFSNLIKSSTYILWYVLLVVVLPAITLIFGGLVYFWQHNLLLIVVAAWLVISALAYGVFIYWPSVKAKRKAVDEKNRTDESNSTDGEDPLPARLDTPDYWSNHDIEVWDRCCAAIDIRLDDQPDWQAMPDLALAHLALVSEEYNRDSKSATLQFTVPELLLVVSVASSRYRQLVVDHVPYIDKISIAKARLLLNHTDNIKSGYSWFNRARRTVRMLNPASAVIGELRELITNKVLTQASDALQTDLKRLLLQEVTQVGIDLYSGKLATSEEELARYQSRASILDKSRQYDALEPLRIVLIGQSSTGKSSLVNLLTQALQAEVGALPVTDRITVHALQLADTTIVNLIDTPGIDGSNETMTLLLKQALEADLIIWLAKATQPARAPDHDLYTQLQASWTDQPSRLHAPIIMGLTHIDQLSPKTVWQPPFDLTGEKPKARSIVDATVSARTRIGFADTVLSVPLYLGEQYEEYNVNALAAQIMLLADQSHNVQRNRRRLELGENSLDWHTRWLQAKKLGKVIGQSVVKRI